MFLFGKRSKAALKDIHPDLVSVLGLAIATSPYDFAISDGSRTAKQQYALWLQGRDIHGNVTDKNAIVTMRDGKSRISNHQIKKDGFGYAVDLYPYVDGKLDYADKSNRLTAIARHILDVAKKYGVKVVWGGDWSQEENGLVDKPHFELRK